MLRGARGTVRAACRLLPVAVFCWALPTAAAAANNETCSAKVGRTGPRDATGIAVELVQVVVVHRHGDRAPIAQHAGVFLQTPELEDFWKSRIPTIGEVERWGRLNKDPTGTHLQRATSGSSKYSFPNGFLTGIGADQMRRVGAELRERYVGDLSFLPSDLPPTHAEELVYARSTRVPRTIQSVQNLLLGLYPEDHRPQGQSAQGTVLINSQDKAQDYMTGLNEKRCPRIKRHVEEADVGLKVPTNYSRLLQRLSPIVGEEDTKESEGLSGGKSDLIDRWVHLGDIGNCHLSHRITPPFNLSTFEVEGVQRYNGWIWGHRLTNSPGLNALAIGGFLKDLLAVFADTIAGKTQPGTSAPKMAIFSGHDSTLFPLLTALGAFDGSWPPYASRVQVGVIGARFHG